MTKKITIVGAGNVGATAAHIIALKELGNIVLLDIAEGVPQGKALDMYEATPLMGSDVKITGTNDYKDTKDSDIVIVTAGVPRKPGMSRDDLLDINMKIMEDVCQQVKNYSPKSILIIVSNPLDAMVYKAWKTTGFPKQRVLGMAGVLDSTRFRSFVAEATSSSVNDVEALVLGGHGDSMVPLKRFTKVSGSPLSDVLNKEEIDKIVERTKNGGAEIVGLLKTGSAFYAPGHAVAEMVESILKDQKKTLPCAALCEGEYGANGLFIGVPVVLGKNGVEKIVELKLDEEEKGLMNKTIAHVEELIKELK